MKKISNTPYMFFFGLVFFFLIISFFVGNKTFDIHIYNTYFTISNTRFCYFSSVFFGLIGVNYFSLHWVQKPPNKWLTGVHITLQTIAILFYILFLLVPDKAPESVGPTPNSDTILWIGFLVFLIATLVHLITFLIAIMKKQ
ncbi:MAG: hypothetical protein GKR88_13655 [Flavobacteriaceae bacterium]|nr:MAG: hypothetical protein GKR88_13655 [Flavobacteriaceae bacterium]